MPQDQIDLAAYFARIGHAGGTVADLPLLRSLVARHTAAIAFANLDTVARRAPLLDAGSLQHKLVRQGRGGYCFEQNTLFQAVLQALGFRVTGLVARVMRGVPPGVVGPRTHMLLRIDLPEGPYIADVGFGGLTPTAPLLLQPGLPQPTPNETFRYAAADGEFILQAQIGDGWDDIYRFALLPQLPIDYEMANWFTATRNPTFIDNLIVTQPTPNTRRTLFNRHFTRRTKGAAPERRVLRSRDDYRQALRDEFGLAVTQDDLDAIMALMERHDPDLPYGGQFA